ncbi:class I SAM-dependent methyltransferase [Nocardia colli]|uniref:Class I SAM-dependent methyltransferase n=1 Tax=Nocardia colli TaxID=2545717 RepID=A0A5N0EDL8_9NOCA|nr:class I SAM-dependent methyltransferase [Nocardia colli]KAA8886235.1 class I SAM-dependent methyltransferase [Nocardia colli]
MVDPDTSHSSTAGAGAAAQRRITSFWQVVAAEYNSPDNLARPGTPGYDDWVSAICGLLPEPPARVLDVGTGTGFVARIAAELGHQVTAIDLSEAMLEATIAPGLAISFAVGDAVDPPFAPGSFDVVINRSLLWTLREPERAFVNWHALLASGGRAVCIYGVNSEAGGPPVDQRKAELFAGYYTREVQSLLPAMRLADHEPVIRLANGAGFDDVEIVELESVQGWEASPGAFQPCAIIAHRD